MQDKIERRIKKDAKKIAKYKDKYKGKRCFIIGNGPSLRMEDLDRLHENKEICFGSNKIYLAFGKTKWKPTFYTIQDVRDMNVYYSEIEKLKIKQKFVAYPYKIRQDFPIFKTFLAVELFFAHFFPYCPNFSDNPCVCIFEGWTVSYFNLQLANYMGFKQIYLLGVDHSYARYKSTDASIVVGEGRSYFTEEKYENRNLAETHKSTLGYIKAELFSRYHDFRIYNATRGGKLEAFERVNFDDLF